MTTLNQVLLKALSLLLPDVLAQEEKSKGGNGGGGQSPCGVALYKMQP